MNARVASRAEGTVSPAGALTSPRTAKTRQTIDRILKAATELFLKEGYSGTNLQQVASAAGVTKPTVYSHFKSKEGLLQAVTAANAETRVAELSLVLRPSDDPRADLMRFGDLLLSKVLSDETRLWDRLAAAESLEHPEVGEAFFRAGPELVLHRLGLYLQQQQRAGLLDVPHSQRAAEQFVGMLLGLDLLRSQVGQPVLRPSRRSQRCREAVDVFLSAYSVRSQ
jgi:TetR/AcrR family transcriptional repressor of mexJK operon